MNALTMRTARAAGGMTRHIPTFAPPAPTKRGKKARHVPDPIKTNGEAAPEELRMLIERVERIEEEIAGLVSDRADVFAEAKGRGYDPKAMKRIMAVRKKKREEFLEEEGTFETYATSLGML